MVGAATAAGLRARFVQHDLFAALRKTNGGGETRNAGADDVDGARHHETKLRIRICAIWPLPSLTGARGGVQPRAISRRKMRR